MLLTGIKKFGFILTSISPQLLCARARVVSLGSGFLIIVVQNTKVSRYNNDRQTKVLIVIHKLQ